ncbi:MAG: twin transmembrane helix small protein [Alphaproteobacteria bacterium]|nr:twin transmembrane helix small protein [Alphaproteobacteria bacterium]MCB9929494.1 twin transmembrane helix small protein [Alphaproteobacteria bacterium]
MSSLLYFLIPLAVLAVVVVLVTGVVGFARGGKFNRQYGNKLMQARVILQFIAVMLLLLLAVVGGMSG